MWTAWRPKSGCGTVLNAVILAKNIIIDDLGRFGKSQIWVEKTKNDATFPNFPSKWVIQRLFRFDEGVARERGASGEQARCGMC